MSESIKFITGKKKKILSILGVILHFALVTTALRLLAQIAGVNDMVQSLGLSRRLRRHRDGSVSATWIGLGRYAQNAT